MSLIGRRVGAVRGAVRTDDLEDDTARGHAAPCRSSVDTRVLLFTAVLSVVTGIIFGLMPAASASKSDLTKALKAGGDRRLVGKSPAEQRSGDR